LAKRANGRREISVTPGLSVFSEKSPHSLVSCRQCLKFRTEFRPEDGAGSEDLEAGDQDTFVILADDLRPAAARIWRPGRIPASAPRPRRRDAGRRNDGIREIRIALARVLVKTARFSA
jgi:hypothetical protein